MLGFAPCRRNSGQVTAGYSRIFKTVNLCRAFLSWMGSSRAVFNLEDKKSWPWPWLQRPMVVAMALMHWPEPLPQSVTCWCWYSEINNIGISGEVKLLLSCAANGHRPCYAGVSFCRLRCVLQIDLTSNNKKTCNWVRSKGDVSKLAYA